MNEKRFQKTRIVDKWGGIYDSETDEILNVNDVEHKLNELSDDNRQLKKLLQEAEEEINKLKKSNQSFMESLVNNESENEHNQETEVRECQFCGEFRTEYHEYEDYSWSAEDYCNAGHDLEDTNPNQCKDYWENW